MLGKYCFEMLFTSVHSLWSAPEVLHIWWLTLRYIQFLCSVHPSKFLEKLLNQWKRQQSSFVSNQFVTNVEPNGP